MASKKITQLPTGSLPTMDGVMPIVLSGTTYQSTLSDLRQNLVDSGSHNFTGSQWINGDLTVSGSGFIESLIVGSGSFFETNKEAIRVENSGSFNVGHFQGNHPLYAQINLKNINPGNRASTDIVVTADNGTDSIHYVDLGINSSTYTGNYVGKENDGYLVNAGNDLYVGTIGSSLHPSNLYLFTQNSWENPQIIISGSKQIGFNTETVSDGYAHEFNGSTKIDGILGVTSTSEVLNVIEGATETIEQSFINGSIYYYTGITSDFIVNFTETPITNNCALSMTLVLDQGETAFLPSEYQINGEVQTVNWPSTLTIIGTSNKIDIISISLMRVNSTWVLLGQLSTFG